MTWQKHSTMFSGNELESIQLTRSVVHNTVCLYMCVCVHMHVWHVHVCVWCLHMGVFTWYVYVYTCAYVVYKSVCMCCVNVRVCVCRRGR